MCYVHTPFIERVVGQGCRVDAYVACGVKKCYV